MQRNKNKKTSGFADTRDYPHKDHPANYRLTGRDSIEYITFTHWPQVKLKNGKVIDTIPLTSNIDPRERKTDKNIISYAYPKEFVGKRSALGKKRTDLSLVPKDKEIVDILFLELPTQHVQYSNKNRKKKYK